MFKYFSERDEVPQILETLDLDGVANYIKSDGCKNVFIMVRVDFISGISIVLTFHLI